MYKVFQQASIYVATVFAMLCVTMPLSYAQSLSDAEAKNLNASVGITPLISNLPAEYKAPPHLWRGFSFMPSLGLQTDYDSNVYAAQNDVISDVAVHIRPGFDWNKEYDGHEFGGSFKGNIERFKSERTENKEEYSADIYGSLNANSRWSFPFSAFYDVSSRSRMAPTQAQATLEPESIYTFNSKVGVVRNFNRFITSFYGILGTKTFDDGVSRVTGDPVIFSKQDNRTLGGFLGLEYVFLRGKSAEYGPEHSIYLNLTNTQKTHDQDNITLPGGEKINADSKNQQVLVGFKTSYKGLLYANIGAGIIKQNFDNDLIKDVTNTDLQAEIAYYLDPKTTWRFKAMREVDQDSDFVRGYLKSTYILGLDYEIYHNLFMKNDLEYQTISFDDEAARDRQDYSIGSNLQYFIAPSLNAGLNVNYKIRKSEESISEFDRLLIMLKLNKTF